MPLSLIRKVVPTSIRKGFGMWTFTQASKSDLFFRLYLLLMWGRIPSGLRLLSSGNCQVFCNQHCIVLPRERDSLWTVTEILLEEVYDRIVSPQKGDVVIDIGAFIGAFTVKASTKVGDRGLIVAIEPEPNNLSYIRHNTKNLPNVVIVDKAVSNRKGEATLYLSDAPPGHTLIGSSREHITVKLDTLDNTVTQLGLSRVDFIKIDVEGMELEVLKGAEKTLGGNVKLSIASYHTLPNGEPEMPLIISFLKERGFKISTWRGEYVYASK